MLKAVLGTGTLPNSAMCARIAFTSNVRCRTSTATFIREEGGFDGGAELAVDERLREKKFGVLDRLTRTGIETLYPEQRVRTIVVIPGTGAAIILGVPEAGTSEKWIQAYAPLGAEGDHTGRVIPPRLDL